MLGAAYGDKGISAGFLQCKVDFFCADIAIRFGQCVNVFKNQFGNIDALLGAVNNKRSTAVVNLNIKPAFYLF